MEVSIVVGPILQTQLMVLIVLNIWALQIIQQQIGYLMGQSLYGHLIQARY